jgi:ubiquinone/menaquinone biosynthesis C-methylase UbiE
MSMSMWKALVPPAQRIAYTASQSLRVARYLSQAITANVLLGRKPSDEQKRNLPSLQDLMKDLVALFRRDLSNIEAGYYKMPDDLVENPVDVVWNTGKVFRDLYQVRDRQKSGKVQEFSNPQVAEGYPKYFAQTFHFQTDGYLSEASARLYDTQVEMVFAGGADAMRRQALVPLHFEILRNPGRDLRLLDIACGTGRFLEFVKQNHPDLKCTGSDLSPYYLKVARERLSSATFMDFVEANAESLPLSDSYFDVITCIYLFHELPRRVRSNVIREMHRLLKPGGLLIWVDSIQNGDKPEFEASLKLFPESYYEPYYQDYIEQDLKAEFENLGFKEESRELAFFSKVLSLRRSET